MRPKTITVTGSTGGPTCGVYVIDTHLNPTQLGMMVAVSGNVGVADVQFTYADPGLINIAPVSAVNWFNSVAVSATSADSPVADVITTPITAVRVRLRALASAGTGERATLTIVQAGS